MDPYSKRKKIELLTKYQQESNENEKNVIFVQKNVKINMLKIKNIMKLEIKRNIDVMSIADAT